MASNQIMAGLKISEMVAVITSDNKFFMAEVALAGYMSAGGSDYPVGPMLTHVKKSYKQKKNLVGYLDKCAREFKLKKYKLVMQTREENKAEIREV